MFLPFYDVICFYSNKRIQKLSHSSRKAPSLRLYPSCRRRAFLARLFRERITHCASLHIYSVKAPYPFLPRVSLTARRIRTYVSRPHKQERMSVCPFLQKRKSPARGLNSLGSCSRNLDGDARAHAAIRRGRAPRVYASVLLHRPWRAPARCTGPIACVAVIFLVV